MPHRLTFHYNGKYQERIDAYVNDLSVEELIIKDKDLFIKDIKSWIKEYAPKYIVEDTVNGITIDNFEIIELKFTETDEQSPFDFYEIKDIYLSAEGYSLRFIIDINAE